MKPMFETSVDVQKCYDFLEGRERATYAEISAHLGRRINSQHDRHVLDGARRMLERDRGIVFVVERGVGVVKANNGQKANLSTTHPIDRIKKVTRKATKRQRLVNIQELSADERLAFAIGRVVLSAVGRSTMKSFRSQIKEQIDKSDGELVAVNQVLALPRHREPKKG